MLSLYINEFLLKKGYKSGPWALRKIGMPSSAAYTLSQPGVRSIKLDHLEHLCQIFDCTPNDLLNYQPGQKDLLPEGHSLLKLEKDMDAPTPMELVKKLRPDEIDEASRMLEEMIRKRTDQ